MKIKNFSCKDCIDGVCTSLLVHTSDHCKCKDVRKECCPQKMAYAQYTISKVCRAKACLSCNYFSISTTGQRYKCMNPSNYCPKVAYEKNKELHPYKMMLYELEYQMSKDPFGAFLITLVITMVLSFVGYYLLCPLDLSCPLKMQYCTEFAALFGGILTAVLCAIRAGIACYLEDNKEMYLAFGNRFETHRRRYGD